MNTTATYETEHSWTRRCSTETVFSIQGKETDVVNATCPDGLLSGPGLRSRVETTGPEDDIARDTSDTEEVISDSDRDLEYEPATEPDDELLFEESTSADSDSAIIKTKVIKVSIEEDGDIWAADSEWTETYESDSEIDHNDYWQCAQCRADNNNPLYRYCQKCFQVRKNFFPPRPKRKKRASSAVPEKFSQTQTLSQDSGIDIQRSQASSSQELSQDLDVVDGTSQTEPHSSLSIHVDRPKRRAKYVDRKPKRLKISESDTESDVSVKPLVKTVSDPSITIENTVKLTKKVLANSLKDNLDASDLCVVCVSQPKSGVFVHGRIAHICCCYKCAMKVWAKAKRCPVCNCKVSNVLRAVVM